MTPPKRQLGLVVASAIVIANMIGAGVFTSEGFQAASLHDPMTMLSTWVVGGILALCGAACYAELGSLMPRAGGEYVYLREAYHPVVGFMSGWVSLTAGFSAPIAVAALIYASYLKNVIPGIDDPVMQKMVACSLIVGVTMLHAFDTKVGGSVQAGFTIAKVVLIAGVIVAGFALGTGSFGHFKTVGHPIEELTTRGGASSYATSLMYVMVAYSGWNAAAYIAGEIKRPQWTLPRSLMIGTAIVMVLYILINAVFIYGLAPEAMIDAHGPITDVGAASATAMFGSSAGTFVATLIALALVSSVSAMMMAGPRVYASMAADHALPNMLAAYNERGVPTIAVFTQCVLAILFVLIGDPDELIQFVGFTLAIFAALTVGAVFVFRARANRIPRAVLGRSTGGSAPQAGQYRTFGYPVTPILFILMSAWIVYLQATANLKVSAIVVAILAVGAAGYVFLSQGRARTPIEADE